MSKSKKSESLEVFEGKFDGLEEIDELPGEYSTLYETLERSIGDIAGEVFAVMDDRLMIPREITLKIRTADRRRADGEQAIDIVTQVLLGRPGEEPVASFTEGNWRLLK